MRKVVKVTPLKDYCILVEFENGENRIGDLKPLLEKKIFSILKDESVFNQVYLEHGAVTWKDNNGNEIDICPDKLYNSSLSI